MYESWCYTQVYSGCVAQCGLQKNPSWISIGGSPYLEFFSRFATKRIYEMQTMCTIEVIIYSDIQGTGQKSHRVKTRRGPSQCFVLIKQWDSPGPNQFMRWVPQLRWSVNRAQSRRWWWTLPNENPGHVTCWAPQTWSLQGRPCTSGRQRGRQQDDCSPSPIPYPNPTSPALSNNLYPAVMDLAWWLPLASLR